MDINPAYGKYRDRINGYTLLELMAVGVLVGAILLLKATDNQPLFDQGRKAEAKVFLLEVASRQASFWQQHMTYAQSLTELNLVVPETLKPYYRFELNMGSNRSGFTAVVVPVADNPLNKTLWVNHLGAHSQNWTF